MATRDHSVVADGVGHVTLLIHCVGSLSGLTLHSSLSALGPGPLHAALVKVSEQLALAASVVEGLADLGSAFSWSPTETALVGSSWVRLGDSRAVCQEMTSITTFKTFHPWAYPCYCLVR